MEILPFEHIYMIYFYVNDYATACNFWVLCKHFTINYMKRYTQSYKYKFNLLSHDLFTFLYLLPEPISINSLSYKLQINHDLDFYEMISTQFLSKNEKQHIRNDIRFLFNLYNSSLISFFSLETFQQEFYFIYMSQGFLFINNFFIINFKQNRITLTFKYHNKNDVYQHFIKYVSSRKQTSKIIKDHIKFLQI